VYCILPDIGREKWGAIGLDGADVYTIGYREICALVHDCPAEPYQGDDETVKGWVWTHGEVIDAAWNVTGSVLPMTFDCIIRPAEGQGAEATVVAWLAAEYDRFRRELAQFAGKVELGVQVIWRVEAITRAAAAADPQIARLQEEMGGKPKGMAYFYQQKIEKALKAALEAKADADYRRYFESVTALAEDVSVNKIKRPAEGKQMLINLSLLLEKERVPSLGQLLDGIQGEEGVEVRFTGPWPPYSFVAKKLLPSESA
jgi:HEPN domain-containing protein